MRWRGRTPLGPSSCLLCGHRHGLQVSHDDHGRHDGLCDHAKDGGRVPVVDLHPIVEAVDEMVAAKHVCPAPDLGVGGFIDDAL